MASANEALSRQEQKEVNDLADYVHTFIANRFQDADKMPTEFREMISDIVIDAFHDGARWSELQARESRIITEV